MRRDVLFCSFVLVYLGCKRNEDLASSCVPCWPYSILSRTVDSTRPAGAYPCLFCDKAHTTLKTLVLGIEHSVLTQIGLAKAFNDAGFLVGDKVTSGRCSVDAI